MLTANNYYINELKNNIYNNNKWIYVDNVDGNLSIKDNKWFFDLNFYVISDSNLPLNLFLINMELPFANLTSYTLDLKNDATILDDVNQKNYCKVYHLSLTIDTGDSDFFNQMLIEYSMYLKISYSMDIDILNNAGMPMSNDKINQVITEWNNIRTNLNFNFSNFYNYNADNGNITNSSEYYLNYKSGFRYIDAPIFYNFKNVYENTTSPIVNLLTLQTQNAFVIDNTRVKFNYSIGDSSTIKTLEYEDKQKYYVYDKHNIEFINKTQYDNDAKEVAITINGSLGFNIPELAYGYYEIQLRILQSNNIRTYKFTRNFSFNNPEFDVYKINIKSIIINNLNNFERIIC